MLLGEILITAYLGVQRQTGLTSFVESWQYTYIISCDLDATHTIRMYSSFGNSCISSASRHMASSISLCVWIWGVLVCVEHRPTGWLHLMHIIYVVSPVCISCCLATNASLHCAALKAEETTDTEHLPARMCHYVRHTEFHVQWCRPCKGGCWHESYAYCVCVPFQDVYT